VDRVHGLVHRSTVDRAGEQPAAARRKSAAGRYCLRGWHGCNARGGANAMRALSAAASGQKHGATRRREAAVAVRHGERPVLAGEGPKRRFRPRLATRVA
jgi:hypothetical protein